MPGHGSPDRRPRRERGPGRRRRALAVLTGLALAVGGTAVQTVAAPAARAAEPVFDQVQLARGVASVGEPLALAVLPDRSVLHTSRDGKLFLTTAAGSTSLAATIPVYFHDEEGLQGVAVDPNFSTNRFVYLYYAPPLSTPADDAPGFGSASELSAYEGVNRLSRFRLGTDGTLDLGSQVTVLDVPATRGLCCHVGGDIDFDAQGNLYLTTGDDTNPFDSSGFTPIDDRPGRNPAFDAQRSSGNTNDLRGKVLRIRVQADGSYTIPEGNLFAPGTDRTRPEIYAMGFRNPFRMSVDKATGIVYLGDYGPDGGPGERGPSGPVEFNRITGPGNYGWPFCVGDNLAYKDYTFPDGPVGAAFDCAGGPVNASPNNTGRSQLPPAQPAWITYDGGSLPAFGSGSESPMGGPVYRYDAANPSTTKFPAEMDGDFFAAEFGRNWIKRIKQGPTGAVGEIIDFPWTGRAPMDMAFGPDGALYVLDYGTGYFGGDANSALYRFDYTSDGRSPTANASATPTSGSAPLSVSFSSAGSSDPGGGALSYAWDFTNDGTTDSTEANPTFTYAAEGTYTAELTVTNAAGLSGTSVVTISVGNTAPTVRINAPLNGSVFTFGDTVPFDVTVTDPEDGPVDCSQVAVRYVFGHDNHGHPLTNAYACTGSITTTVDGEHDANANTFGVWIADYTDDGGLRTTAEVRTQPALKQAEYATSTSGIQILDKPTAQGGRAVGYLDDGDWVAFTPYNLSGVTSFTARVASGGVGGTLSVRLGSPTGPLAGSVSVPVTGGWEQWQEVTGTISDPGGTNTLYLVATGAPGALFDIDSFTLTKPAGASLLSSGRPATASSQENDSHPASNATDGNTGTRWSSAFADPQWVSVDLGATRSVTRARLSWEAAYGSAYEVQTSTDGTSWSTAASTTGGDGGIDDLTFAARDARYVRVYGTARGTPWGYSLWELEVYGR